MFKFAIRPCRWWLGFPVAIGAGVVLGLVNGLLVTLFRLPAIIVTLGTLNLYRGLTFIISDATPDRPAVRSRPAEGDVADSPTYAVPWIILIALGGDPAAPTGSPTTPASAGRSTPRLEPGRGAASRHPR